MSTCRFSDKISVCVRVSPCAPRPMSSRDGAPSLCASLAAGPLPAAADEPLLELLELLELELLEVEPDEELLLELAPLLVLELLPLELLLELPDLLASLRSVLAAAPGLSTVETPPHPARTAAARHAAAIIVFFKQRFAKIGRAHV